MTSLSHRVTVNSPNDEQTVEAIVQDSLKMNLNDFEKDHFDLGHCISLEKKTEH